MRNNDTYVGLMEGRFPFAIESRPDPEDPDGWIATYEGNGVTLEARSTSASDAHNRCTDLVREAARQGHLTLGY